MTPLRRLLWLLASLRRSDAGDGRTPYDIAANQGAHQLLGLWAWGLLYSLSCDPFSPSVGVVAGWLAWEGRQLATGDGRVRARWDAAADLGNELGGPMLAGLAVSGAMPVWAAAAASLVLVSIPAAFLGRLKGE